MDVVCLLKILPNFLYLRLCVLCDRKSNDIQRAAFTVDEVVDLTINFTEEIISNILSSGILKNADYTMEIGLGLLKQLRT
jgi:predicted DNA-binding helix-hairpin-helix protein